jgi:hypothetical protein
VKRHVEPRFGTRWLAKWDPDSKALVYLFIALAVIYAAVVLILPIDPVVLERYDITETGARLLNLTVILPAEAIWFGALYGYIRLKSYARLIGGSAEGSPFNRLADGLGILALSLPFRGVVSAVMNHLTVNDPGLETVATVVPNYIGLAFSVVSFMLIASGAHGLLTSLRNRGPGSPVSNYAVLALILLSSVFTWLILSGPAGSTSEAEAYQSPAWIVILTLAVPYLFAWYQGALATYRLYVYKSRVEGHLYREAFGNISAGIGLILFLSILIQLITTISERLNRLELTPVLLLIYLLVLLYAVGFGLVAKGAKKFKKIEEV